MNKIKVGLFALAASAVGLFAFKAPDSSNVKPFGVFNYSDTSNRDSTHHKDKWKKKDHKKDTTAMLSKSDSSMTLALNDSLKSDSTAMLALNNIADTTKKDTAKKETSKKTIALAMFRSNDSAVAKILTDSNAVRMDSIALTFSKAGDSLQISKGDSIVALTKNDSVSFTAYNVRLLQGFTVPARAEVRGIYS